MPSSFDQFAFATHCATPRETNPISAGSKRSFFGLIAGESATDYLVEGIVGTV